MSHASSQNHLTIAMLVPKSRLVIHAGPRTRNRFLCGLAHPVSPCAARCQTRRVYRALLHGATQPVSLCPARGEHHVRVRRCRPRPFATARGKLELAHARGVGSSRAGRGSGGVHPAAGKARAWASLCKLGAGSWSQPMAAGGRHVLGRGVPGLGSADHGGPVRSRGAPSQRDHGGCLRGSQDSGGVLARPLQAHGQHGVRSAAVQPAGTVRPGVESPGDINSAGGCRPAPLAAVRFPASPHLRSPAVLLSPQQPG